MTLNVLRAGLDTVEISFRGEFSEEMISALDASKKLAQLSDGPVPFEVGLIELMMQPTAFGKWRWRLVTPRFTILAKPKAAQGSVVAQVRLNPFGLANEHLDMLWMLARITMENLGALTEIGVARADVCVDFQGWSPTPADMKGMVCAASKRSTHGTEAGVQTFTYGSRTLLRIYEKSVQIVEKKKLWWLQVWGACDGYVADSPVWRAEFQTIREVLKQVGIATMSDLIEKQGALLDYGLTWAQLRVPSNDTTKRRWPEDERWTKLRTALFDGIPLQRSVEPSTLMSLDRVVSAYIGLLASVGAYFDDDRFMPLAQRLAFIAEVRIANDGIDLAKHVEEKRRRIMSGDV